MSLAERSITLGKSTFSFAVDAFNAGEKRRKGVFTITATAPDKRAERFMLAIDWDDPILYRFGGREALDHKQSAAEAFVQSIEAQEDEIDGSVCYFYLLAGSSEKGSLVYWDRGFPKEGWTITRSTGVTL